MTFDIANLTDPDLLVFLCRTIGQLLTRTNTSFRPYFEIIDHYFTHKHFTFTYSHLWNSSAARTLILANFSIEYRLILHTTVISFSIIPQQHSYLNHNFNSSGQRISTVVVIFENVSTQHYYSAVYYYLLSEISKKHPYYLTHYYLVNEITMFKLN